MEEEKIVSSVKLFWKTTTQHCKMPSTKGGIWPLPGEDAREKDPRQDNINERFIL